MPNANPQSPIPNHQSASTNHHQLAESRQAMVSTGGEVCQGYATTDDAPASNQARTMITALRKEVGGLSFNGCPTHDL